MPGSASSMPPWSLYRDNARGAFPFFLDRAGAGRPSFAGANPVTQLIVRPDGTSRIWDGERWAESGRDPVQVLAQYIDESGTSEQVPGFEQQTLPRTVGYIGYELAGWIEDIPAAEANPSGAPLAMLSTYEEAAAHDTVTGKTRRLRLGCSGKAPVPPSECEWIAACGRDTPRSANAIPQPTPAAEYRAGFERIAEAIASGEIYQANLSRRMLWPTRENPETLYRRLRERQPVPEGAYLDLGFAQILSNSPESFLRVSGDKISTRPIKGTRSRGRTPEEDERLQDELRSDAKEGAEHVMIVDLERNDLGRICAAGSVRVEELGALHTFETLHHLITVVRGTLRPGTSTEEILRATFPGGSITGAPKVQAMRVIAEVETTRRGVYTGLIGCMNGARSMDTSIAIRTGFLRGGLLHYSSGGGIVADSGHDAEWIETETKATAMQSILETSP